MYYREDNEKTTPFVHDLMKNYENPQNARPIMLEIMDLFPADVTEYYHCMYCRVTGNTAFEELAVSYLNSHDIYEWKSQKVLYSLLGFYIPDELLKARPWCDQIREINGLSFDLYSKAIEYYSKVGDYDIAELMLTRLTQQINAPGYDSFLYSNTENAPKKIEKLFAEVQRYRTKNPYWPKTEARKRIVAEIYDAKGIAHPRINKPVVVNEAEFSPLKECSESELDDYCAFWCAEVFSVSGVKAVYQIAALKVRANKEIDAFQSYIKPWDGAAVKEAAAKAAGVDLTVIKSAEDVDLVMKRFLDFVGDDTLVSTDALGNQAKCISRVARYSGLFEIENPFFDLLDYAAEVSENFDMAHNNREYLLSSFGLTEGTDALSKAKLNVSIYNRLKALDK
jgi:hypothetical protein